MGGNHGSEQIDGGEAPLFTMGSLWEKGEGAFAFSGCTRGMSSLSIEPLTVFDNTPPSACSGGVLPLWEIRYPQIFQLPQSAKTFKAGILLHL